MEEAVREKFRRAVTESGMTQTQIAAKMGITQNTLCKILCGTLKLKVDTLLKLCGAIGKSPDEVLGVGSAERSVQRNSLIVTIRGPEAAVERVMRAVQEAAK